MQARGFAAAAVATFTWVLTKPLHSTRLDLGLDDTDERIDDDAKVGRFLRYLQAPRPSALPNSASIRRSAHAA